MSLRTGPGASAALLSPAELLRLGSLDFVARLVVEDLGRAAPALAPSLPTEPRAERPRVLVLTDIENEPDDAMSMVRFLVYGNQWEIEGLVATTSIHQKDRTAPWRIREIVEAYGKVRDNLLLHEPGFPTTNYLLSVLKEGPSLYGMVTADNAGSVEAGERRIGVVGGINNPFGRGDRLEAMVYVTPTTASKARSPTSTSARTTTPPTSPT